MIIECQTCHARFRLDESRVKGRGARVKCRKCGDSIIVLKGGAPAPPAPEGEGLFDLGSAVRDSAGESPASPPPPGNLIPFPVASRPVEPEISAGQDLRPKLDLGALTLDFRPEEKLDLPPAEELKPLFGEPPAVEPSTGFRAEEGVLVGDSDVLNFLREKDRDAGAEAPPEIGDISLEISPTRIEETHPYLREPDAPPTPREAGASPSPEGISLEGNATPPAAPVIEVPPRREEEPAPMPPVESPVHHESPAPESPPRRFSSGPVVAAALAVLLAVGGYLGLTTSGRKTLEGAVPGISKLWGGKSPAPAGPKYDLRNVIGYYESSDASPRILVIKGQVANLSTVEKSGIRVHAALLDNTDAILAQQVVYAGNMPSGEAIRKGNRDTLSKVLGNRFGEGLTNMHVSPGKAIPFMVVFFDAPANMDSYKLEAKDGE